MTKVTKILIIVLGINIFSLANCFAQNGEFSSSEEIKMEHSVMNDLNSEIYTVRNIVKYIIGAALAISLIVVIYHVANDAKYGKGKQAAVSWLVAVIIYLIAINIMPV